MQQTIRTGNVYSAIVFQNRLKTRGQKKVIIIKNMNILLSRVSLLLSVEDSCRGDGSDTHSITEEQNSALGGVGAWF